MKYIKTYEENINKEFWLVRTDEPYFFASLYKIGVNDKNINNYKNYSKIYKFKKIYVGIFNNKEQKVDWNPYKKVNGSYLYYFKSFEYEGYKYKGEVKLTPDDIEKWELKNDIKKFNL